VQLLWEQARRVAVLTIWHLDTDPLGEPTSKGGEFIYQNRQIEDLVSPLPIADPRASLPFKRQLGDESITSLGKSVDDLPPLPCGLP
jgi:hypothetical protein